MTISEKFLYWTPRVLSLAFVGFLSIFALDVFSEGVSLAALGGFVVHLLPSLVLLAAVLLAWKREWIGAVIFIGFGIFYIWSVGFSRPWSWYASIAGPSLLVGILYLVGWLKHRGHPTS